MNTTKLVLLAARYWAAAALSRLADRARGGECPRCQRLAHQLARERDDHETTATALLNSARGNR